MITDFNEIEQKIEKYRNQRDLYREKRALFEQLRALYQELLDSYLELYDIYRNNGNHSVLPGAKDGPIVEFRQKVDGLNSKRSTIRTEIEQARLQLEELQRKNDGWLVWNYGK